MRNFSSISLLKQNLKWLNRKYFTYKIYMFPISLKNLYTNALISIDFKKVHSFSNSQWRNVGISTPDRKFICMWSREFVGVWLRDFVGVWSRDFVGVWRLSHRQLPGNLPPRSNVIKRCYWRTLRVLSWRGLVNVRNLEISQWILTDCIGGGCPLKNKEISITLDNQLIFLDGCSRV